MFEAHVLHLLRRYLGEYVHGLSAEALRISVWKGDVVLKDLKLKAEALNSLKLPVTVKAGFVGCITLKVPWKSLGKEPVIVLIDRVFVLAHPASDSQTLKEEDREKLFEAKLQQIEEAEAATIEALSKSKLGSPPGNSWLGSLIATIIGNLKISISNVHVRYEDSISHPGYPFSSGVTLAMLAAVTMDEQGNETFDASGAVDKLRKSLKLERLAMYHDCDSPPWKIGKRWEDLNPKEWIEIFEDGINEPVGRIMGSKWALNRSYLVSPINGVLKYHRLGKQERNDPEIPFEKASLAINDVSLTVTEAQYHDWIKLMEVVSRYKTYVEVSHLRPVRSVSEDPHLWWRYAAQASLQQKKICYRFLWDRIKHLCQLRRHYVQLYAGLLQQPSSEGNSALRVIERDLDSKVILLWRLLAHAKVESVRSKEAAERRRLQKNSWFSFRWRTSSEDDLESDAAEESQTSEGRLTKEEWQAINNLLSYQLDEDLPLPSGKDMQNMVRFLVTVSICQAAARIVNIENVEIICGRFEQLQVSTKLKYQTTCCDVSLRFYGLSAPEGSLAESVSSEQKKNALAAGFVSSPVGENVDWKLSATISPCHVTVWMESYIRLLEFIKRSNAISPTVAFETATALQNKIEMVTRRAQEQFQMVLEEQSRFALDIDLDAPKVRIPIRTPDFSKCVSHLLLDFGHFTLKTMDTQFEEQRQNVYSRFCIYGRDISAFFSECASDCHSCVLVKPTSSTQQIAPPLSVEDDRFCSLLDRCGMAVVVDKIKVPHPNYPSTRISIQVPNLGVHFSPSRYHRLIELSNILYGTMEVPGQPPIQDFLPEFAPWSHADLSTDARILVWKGIGNSMAMWQPCFLILSGFYLYVLESEKSQSYQRCLSVAGRQIQEVPPTNIGGSPFCVAVGLRGVDTQKALESSSTWVMEFRDEEVKATWLKGLLQATYQASAPPSVDLLGERSENVAEQDAPKVSSSRTADIVIHGNLVEAKLFIYGKSGDSDDSSIEEALILEVLAGGGKVHIILLEGDLSVKAKLHSLKIKDALQGCTSASPQYLAYSVLKNEHTSASLTMYDSQGMGSSTPQVEEDDVFKDALPDFMSLAESSMSSHEPGVSMVGGFIEAADALLCGKDVGIGKGFSGDIFYETQGNDNLDFVSVTFSTRSSGSLDYDGVDTQMTISMSKLEFFCNRRTVVALIGFGFDVSSITTTVDGPDKTSDVTSFAKEKLDDSGIIKGLLGYGKGRVVFNLYMKVDSVCLFLNKEDGSKLAMLEQESFLLDIKVYPSSLSIEGTLGNFRLCDMSLGADSYWSWLCDIRNPGCDSLIKFKLNSYSADDDDYEGYDYSLHGKLSAVRIVFLYRFVQEVMAYFMGLASPHPDEAIKLVDKVGGFEWLINKYEIDGSTALKLDLSLDTPIIIVPRNSMSKDFIQLDLGQLQVTNDFKWYGCPDEDPSAVHMDVLHAEILGINMSVGIDGRIGKPMIREGQGLDVYVQRSLRDVFRKVPNFSLAVKVGLLHAAISDKEYGVVLDCLYLNLCEEPRLPPSFRGSSSASKDTMRLLADKVNTNSQMLLSRTVTIIAVEVDYALLELCNGVDEESSLAHIVLEGLWVSYRMTSLFERDLYVTIPRFSILDIRPETKSEMRLMLGSSTDSSKVPSSGDFSYSTKKNTSTSSEAGIQSDVPKLTMFLMDYRLRTSSQSVVVRIQQPKVLVVPDFLLAVGEFFVPALGAMTGREETMDPKNDPITNSRSIILTESVHKQCEDVVHLSPSRQLVADAPGIDEYIYDGCGQTICLNEKPDSNDFQSARSEPIIIIGCGKKLRFINVKIENGFLLRKCTYMSYDSSYSVSFEDGVDILQLDNFTSGSNTRILDSKSESIGTSNALLPSQDDSNPMQSFTFEGQVFAPEFTFYDGTKSFLDDSSQSERLLRAKMDLSFMYAAKENDTWIRATVKDLMLEAGSGLVIIDPVDISGGYTSVKEKTNISVLSTDICIHLSLSAISLVHNLLSQAAAALQFGNTVPLAPCTNFDRLWVSPKDGGSGNYLTFWRPQAPPNYVVLGDSVTSRPSAPSQAVMAVSNSYGRVRKPISFDFVGMFSAILGYGSDREGELDNDCSIWMPVAPAGYTALGCVVHLGSEPPPNHIVYCVRSDLVTSTVCSECIYTSASSSTFASGFSIWRWDNVVASFFAQASTEYPPKKCGLDLRHTLLWSSMQHHVASQESTSASMNDHDNQSQEANDQSTSPSGWDVLRSISKATDFYISTPHFERIWWDKGNDVRRPVSVWRPVARPSYAVLGDCITEGLEPPALGIVFRSDNPEYTARPVQFTKVAQIVVKGVDEISFWYPIAPPGYVALGCMASRVDLAPSLDLFCCPRMDLVSQANILEMPISRSSTSKASQCWSIWKVENQACTFLARSDLKKPSSRLAYTICDSVKPKTRENITAETRLKRFSLTVLDSSYGMVTPRFDVTITNIKLATHGQLDAMNAVLISSIAASTFNTHLEAWEPLVEPFDGIFKFETYATDGNTSSKLGKRIRMAATNMLNINVSAANLETFVETIVSWRRILELEQKAAKLNEEAGRDLKSGQRPTVSALDEDDLQRIVVENKLGCNFYLKRMEENMDTVDLLHDGDCTSVWIPPPRFSDRLNVADESREARHYVCIQILEAKGLTIADDGNSHNFFCALRLLVDNQTTDQQKIYPQSARTRCAKPLISKDGGTAKWNELFIFEVPRKGIAKLEVEVTNLAAKAGKGEVVGAFSFSVGHGVHKLKKVASSRMFYHPNDPQNVTSFPLKRKHQTDDAENMHDCGILLASTSYFERNTRGEIKEDTEEENGDKDVGFWIGVSEKGTWESIRSSLPLSVAPKLLENDYIAMEVFLKEGKKHAVFRSLVTVVNDSDVKLELSVCSVASVQSSSSSSATSKIMVEEIFQNQRCHPISGWRNSGPGLRDNDPGHWSTGDFSYSSKDFFEPSLPTGWRWASPWAIEKSGHVDADGWAYGPDFQSLRWPLSFNRSSLKSAKDTVRRRRWICSRQQLPEQALDFQNGGLITINPGSSSVLSWKSTLMNSDECLRIRPCADQTQTPYSWGQAVAIDSGFAGEKEQSFSDQGSRQRPVMQGDYLNSVFMLNQLQKKDILLVSSIGRKQFWLSVGTDASVLQTDLNAPVYDWKISVNSPLKMENRLPCSAEFTIWEKTKQGNFVECQRGIINSREVMNIYNADVQKPLYLSLCVQGGWSLEKDPVLFSDLSSNQRISSLWMVQQQSRRRIRFSMEHDMGGSNIAPRTIRFFVPYWIANDTYLHLAYRLVEMEYAEHFDADNILLSRAVKSAKTAFRSPSLSMSRRNNNSKRTVQVLEVIEDSSPTPSMLSPLDYANRSGALFQSQKDSFLSPRIGISVAVRGCDIYSPGISLLELEKKERVDVKAYAANGSYYKLSAQLTVSSDRTKVVHFLPHTLFINRVGRNIYLKQCDSQWEERIHSTDPPKQIGWQSSSSVELLKVRVDGYEWSTPFSVSSEGRMRLSLLKESGIDHKHLRVQVRSGTKRSRYEVVFRPNFFSCPYRIENRSMFLPIRFRQVGCTSNSWQFLLPNAAASFLWEDLGRRRFLELMVDGSDECKTEKYCIDEAFDYQPIQAGEGVLRALQIGVSKEEKVNIVKVTDWMPEYESSTIRVGLPPPSQDYSKNDGPLVSPSSGSEFHVMVEFAELGISIIDHTPEEILYLSIQNLLLAYSTGLGSGISRFKLRMGGLQVDNQLPLTPMPVLFRPHKVGEEGNHVLKFSVTIQSNGSLDLCVYPYIGVQGPENSAFVISIHEPIIWRLHEMIQQVNLSRLYETRSTAVSVDPIIQIGVLNLSEVRFKVSMAMSPSQRPRGVLGFWSSLMTALGNTENMPVKINQRFHENVSMRQSSMISNAILNIRKDLLTQPLQLLSGVDILGNASSALGHMSKGVAALSMDKKFIQSRQRQENKGVEDLSDVIREGGGALAKGLFRGVTGILTKPLEGAKTSGVEGFVQGVGKGLIGAAAQPVSGVLDLLSKTTEGANAMRMKIVSAITSEEQLLRRRLPRVIGGDNLLRPYDEYKAEGQVMLQLAECGSFLGQVDLFKVRGKFALSDAYEDHFVLPKAKILVVTHRRIILLQQTSNIIAQRKFNPARDPCSVLWEVLWDDLVTMELTHGKKDHPKAPFSQLVLYLKSRPPDYKELSRVIKCTRDTPQALEIYSSIERAMNTYGPNKLKDSLKNMVPKPYSPRVDNTDGDIISKDTAFMWSSQQVPPSVPHSSVFGSNST